MEIINKILKKIGIDKEKDDNKESKIEISEEDVVDIEIPKIEITDSFNNEIIIFE